MGKMKMNKKTGIARVFSAFSNSSAGFVFLAKNEAAFKQEAIAFIVLSPLAFYWGNSLTEIAVLLMSLFIVIIVEIINTAIEAVIDRIGSEYHQLSGLAKDLGSAAVLTSILMLVIVWSVVGWNNFN
jgi:diacylglycerol kinase (ATP)